MGKNNIENIVVKKYKQIFFVISILLFVAYGIAIYFYTAFNLFYTRYDVSFYLPSFVSYMNNHAIVIDIILNKLNLKYFFEVPWAFMVSSLICKYLFLVLLYKIIELLTKDKYQAIVVTLLFSLSISPATHGHVFNGIWGSPIFYRASASALLILSGVYAALRNRLILSSIAFSLALQFHFMNGVSALFIFSSGYLYHKIKSNTLDIKKHLIPCLILFINFFYFLRITSKFDLPGIEVSVRYWYDFIKDTNPDDLFFLWTFSTWGYSLLPLLFFSFYIVYKSKDKREPLDNLFLGSAILLIVFIAIEILHRSGIFFGRLSEIFILLGFKKGLWIVYLFAITIITRFLLQLKNIEKKNIILIILFINVYLQPHSLNVAILVLCLILLKFDKKTVMLSLVFLFSLLLCFYEGNMPLQKEDVKNFVFVAFSTMIIYFLFTSKRIDYRSVFIVTISFFLLVSTIFGLYSGRLYSDIVLISNNGFFKLPDFRKLIINVYGGTDDRIVYDTELVDAISRINQNHETVLLPFSPNELDELDPFVLNSRAFLCRADFSLSIYSKELFENVMYKVAETFSIDNHDEILNEIKDIYNNTSRAREKYIALTKEHLIYMNKKHQIRYLVTSKFYDGFYLLYKSNRYYLYDLNKSKL